MLEAEIKKHIREVGDFPSPGVSYKDISPILANPSLCRKVIEAFSKEFRGKIDAVCGIESRGFLFGFSISKHLGVPFIMARKQGKLPGETFSEAYELEYGKAAIEVSQLAIEKNWRVMIHDDVLATGGTARALANLLVDKFEVNSLHFSFLIELSLFNGIDKIRPLSTNIISLAKY